MIYQGDSYIIEKQGKPVAAVVLLEVYEQWRERRDRFFTLLREVQAKNIDTESVETGICGIWNAIRESSVFKPQSQRLD